MSIVMPSVTIAVCDGKDALCKDRKLFCRPDCPKIVVGTVGRLLELVHAQPASVRLVEKGHVVIDDVDIIMKDLGEFACLDEPGNCFPFCFAV